MAPLAIVSEVTSLDEIYPVDVILAQGKRWNSLLEKFQATYGRPAEFVARCPGRVNVIGEHIDYSLYEVLPMAVTSDIVIAVATVPANETTGTSAVQVSNVQSDKFPTRKFTIPHKDEIEINDQVHEWSNYFKAGAKGALELVRKHSAKGNFKPVGMDVMIHGTVPAGGGLSSSAAFTCASALATLAANGEKAIDKSELVSLSIVSERFVGVNSGGMDQSASVFGQKDNALYVSFTPSLKATPFSFPRSDPPLTFVIANSFVQADKRKTAKIHYNLRVVETTLAAEVLARKYDVGKLPSDSGPLGSTLRGFHTSYLYKYGKESGLDKETFEAQLEEMLQLAKEGLDKKDGYTMEEIASIMGISEQQLTKSYMTRFPVSAKKFQLQKRAVHVFTEALRVLKFTNLLENAPDNASISFLESLGAIMDQSQASCRDVFDCSAPELDELCQLARSAGSLGSRLTGAGWGGCTVHLVPENKLEAVKQVWKKEYYEKKFPHVLEKEGGFEDAVVVSKPGSGAILYRCS